MGTTQKPRIKPSAIITQDNVCHAISDLEDMAKRPKRLSLIDVVTQIQPYVRAALAQGYSPEDVCSVLGKRNIAISPVTLKRYLKRVEGGKADGKENESTDPASPTSGGKKRLDGEGSAG